MQENGENNEFFEKYCPHIGGRVTLVSGHGERSCLSCHLCHGQKCENRSYNTVFCAQGKSGVDINEKQKQRC